ncbi:hypothetical protein IE53DRAFT_87248 [Violaceomyces palustris]|uniref:Uncharacterized protein n=1 Tax=Violaceomyces palustris TaxID=1673888 RepID=A0ACD0NXZ8_9BASI|nr:hypothetical protein IE53DRAFT_87248 [Violaceomyces palustris]
MDSSQASGSSNHSPLFKINDLFFSLLKSLLSKEEDPPSFEAIELISMVTYQPITMALNPGGSLEPSSPGFSSALIRGFSDSEFGADSTDPIPNRSLQEASMKFIEASLKLLEGSLPESLTRQIAISVLSYLVPRLIALIKETYAQSGQNVDTGSSRSLISTLTRMITEMGIKPDQTMAMNLLLVTKDEVVSLVSSSTGSVPIFPIVAPPGDASKTPNELNSQKCSWYKFIDLNAVLRDLRANPSMGLPVIVEPELVALLHFFVDERQPLSAKESLMRRFFLARSRSRTTISNADMGQELASLYYEILIAAVKACSAVVATPPVAVTGAPCSYAAIWRSTICGLLPALLSSTEHWFTTTYRGDQSPEALSEASISRVETVIQALFSTASATLRGCESPSALGESQNQPGEDQNGADQMVLDSLIGTDTPPNQPLRALLLRSLVEHELLRVEVIAKLPDMEQVSLDPALNGQSIKAEAQHEGIPISSWLAQRFESEHPLELLERSLADPGSQLEFFSFLSDQFLTWAESGELDHLSRWCKALMDHQLALEISFLFISPESLCSPLVCMLDRSDLNQINDEPSTLSNILLLLQFVNDRFIIGPESSQSSGHYPPRSGKFFSIFSSSSSVAYLLTELSVEEKSLVGRWISALFDNEGISDDLIKDSSPQTLLRLAPTLFSQSISACSGGMIDLDTLRGGLSYFLQDLLSYTLPAALKWLIREIQRIPLVPVSNHTSSSAISSNNVESGSVNGNGNLNDGAGGGPNSRTVHLEVLSLLLASDTCPFAVKRLVADDMMVLFASPTLSQSASGAENFDIESIKTKMEACFVPRISWISSSTWIRALLGDMIKSEGSLFLRPSLEQVVPRIGIQGVLNKLVEELVQLEKQHSSQARDHEVIQVHQQEITRQAKPIDPRETLGPIEGQVDTTTPDQERERFSYEKLMASLLIVSSFSESSSYHSLVQTSEAEDESKVGDGESRRRGSRQISPYSIMLAVLRRFDYKPVGTSLGTIQGSLLRISLLCLAFFSKLPSQEGAQGQGGEDASTTLEDPLVTVYEDIRRSIALALARSLPSSTSSSARRTASTTELVRNRIMSELVASGFQLGDLEIY